MNTSEELIDFLNKLGGVDVKVDKFEITCGKKGAVFRVHLDGTEFWINFTTEKN